MRHLRLFLAAAAVAALGCGGDDNPSGPDSGGDGSTTVTPNSTVTWNWNSGGVVHNVTFPDANSGDKSSGTFQRTFPTAGTFNYLCTIHGPTMSGSVIVSSTAGNDGGTGGGGGGGGGDYP